MYMIFINASASFGWLKPSLDQLVIIIFAYPQESTPPWAVRQVS